MVAPLILLFFFHSLTAGPPGRPNRRLGLSPRRPPTCALPRPVLISSLVPPLPLSFSSRATPPRSPPKVKLASAGRRANGSFAWTARRVGYHHVPGHPKRVGIFFLSTGRRRFLTTRRRPVRRLCDSLSRLLMGVHRPPLQPSPQVVLQVSFRRAVLQGLCPSIGRGWLGFPPSLLSTTCSTGCSAM